MAHKKLKKYKRTLEKAVIIIKNQEEEIISLKRTLKKACAANKMLEAALKVGAVAIDFPDFEKMMHDVLAKERERKAGKTAVVVEADKM